MFCIKEPKQEHTHHEVEIDQSPYNSNCLNMIFIVQGPSVKRLRAQRNLPMRTQEAINRLPTCPACGVRD